MEDGRDTETKSKKKDVKKEKKDCEKRLCDCETVSKVSNKVSQSQLSNKLTDATCQQQNKTRSNHCTNTNSVNLISKFCNLSSTEDYKNFKFRFYINIIDLNKICVFSKS